MGKVNKRIANIESLAGLFAVQVASNGVYTYEANGPDSAAVYDKPSLLTESSDLLLLAKSHVFSERSQDILHSGGAEPGQENDNKEDEVDIIKASAIFLGPLVVVLQVEELGSIGLGPGEEIMGAE